MVCGSLLDTPATTTSPSKRTRSAKLSIWCWSSAARPSAGLVVCATAGRTIAVANVIISAAVTCRAGEGRAPRAMSPSLPTTTMLFSWSCFQNVGEDRLHVVSHSSTQNRMAGPERGPADTTEVRCWRMSSSWMGGATRPHPHHPRRQTPASAPSSLVPSDSDSRTAQNLNNMRQSTRPPALPSDTCCGAL